MTGSRLLAVLLLGGRCAADLHHLFTSSFSTPHLYSLQFDDQKNSLIEVANISAHDGHPWIGFSYDKASLYAGEGDGFASYMVENSTSLVYSQSVKVGFECGGRKDGFGSPYVLASLRSPFTVFGATSTGCGAAMSVEPDGRLQTLIQAYKYREGSTIRGLAVDPESKYLYSADESGNSIWIHLINDKGTLNQVGNVVVPFPNSGPRHLIVHPDGHYLYVVLATSNLVAVYAINSGIGSDLNRLTFTGTTYSLIPPGTTYRDFSANEVLLSLDANLLVATTRYTGLASSQGRGQKKPGYVTAVLLTSMAERDLPVGNRQVGAGFPIRQVFQITTTTSGGQSNKISPAPWSGDYFAMTDSQLGLVEIWKINGLAAVNRTGNLAEGARTPPKGGWVSNNWSPTGSLLAGGDTPNTPTQPIQPGQPYRPPGGRPRSTVTVWAGGQTPRPTRGYQPYQPQPLPYPPPYQQNQPYQPYQPQPYQQPQQPGWSRVDEGDQQDQQVQFNQKSTTDEQTDSLTKRQWGGTLHITAGLVAVWKAPIGGGEPGRRNIDIAMRYTAPEKVIESKPWTGSKARRGVEQDPAPALPVLPTGPPTEAQLASYIKAQSQGKSCCTNAVWWD